MHAYRDYKGTLPHLGGGFIIHLNLEYNVH